MKRFVAIGSVALAACSSTSTTEHVETLEQKIVGGTTDTDDPAVVEMKADFPGSYATCTGTLIAPNVVLTAAHCIEDHPQKVSVYFGTYANNATATDWKPVKEWHQHPSYPHPYINEGNDCAVLVLQDAVTGVTPKPFSRTTMTSSSVGRSARIVGFGHTNGAAQTGAGTKRTLDTTIHEVNDGVLGIGKAGATSCQGDSGGPVFIDDKGVETVAGVASYGEQGCTGIGSYSRTELCADWIDSFLGGAPPTDDPPPPPPPPQDPTACAEQEPNDSFYNANRACGVNKGALSTAYDSDTYTFTAGPNATYDIFLPAAPSAVQIALYKVTSTGYSYVGYGTDEAGGRRILRTTPTGGTYYLSTYNWEQGAAGGQSYEVTVDLR